MQPPTTRNRTRHPHNRQAWVLVILACLLAFWSGRIANAQESAPLSFTHGKVYLIHEVSRFVADHPLTYADISSGEFDTQFTRPDNAYLVQDKDNWYRFTITNHSTSVGEWVLSLNSTLIDNAELFYTREDGQLAHLHTGLKYSYASRPVPYNLLVFPIQQAAGTTQTYYLRLNTPFQVYLSPTLTDYSTFIKDAGINFSLPHLFIGVLMGVFIYLLVLSFSAVSEIMVHRFVWFVFFAMLVIIYVDGFLTAYLPDNEWLTTRLWVLLHIGLQMCYVRATQGFFHTKARYPFVNYYLIGCNLIAITVFILLFLVPYKTVVSLELWNAAQVIFCMAILSIYIWIRERNNVTLFVVGNLGLLIMAAISTFAAISSLTANDWFIQHGFELGFCWQAIFFTWALSRKINELAKSSLATEAESKAKGEFIAKMSHEIRTPMNGVLGMTQLLHSTTLNEEQKHYLNVIDSSGKTLLAVINDILDYSKLIAGKIALAPNDFNLEKLLAELNTLFGDMAHSKKLSFSIIVTPGTPLKLYGDEIRLRQILTNLLSNAFKFTERGVVVLKVKPLAITPVPASTQRDVTLQFQVQDTGIGISDEDQKHLFQSFSQADTHIARRYGGTGLGLSICKQFVEMMGGTIAASSRPEQGSEFVFTVRMQTPAIENLMTDISMPSPIRHFQRKLKILVAEDDNINRTVLSSFLSKAGCEAEFVFNGKEAVDQLSHPARSYDIVLMDCEMPVMDGLAATQLIRQMEKKSGRKPVPIVALTAHTSASYLQRCLDEGMTAHLCKPIAYDDLRTTIERLTP